MGRLRFDPANPPRLTSEQLTALDALTPNLIEQNAESDPDNPPLTNAELKRMQTARAVRAVRASRGMTQAAFAETYGIAVTRLRDWEQGRHVPDSMALAYLATIAHEPEAVARAFEKARAA